MRSAAGQGVAVRTGRGVAVEVTAHATIENPRRVTEERDRVAEDPVDGHLPGRRNDRVSGGEQKLE